MYPNASEWFMVPGLGFEPRLPGPEPGVLPLDDPGLNMLTSLWPIWNRSPMHIDFNRLLLAVVMK